MSLLSAAGPARSMTNNDLARLKKYLAETLVRALEMEGGATTDRNKFIKENIGRVFDQTQLKLPEDLKKQIFNEVLNDLLGYGPIQSLLDDPDISEIMVNGPKKVFVEKKGQLTKSSVTFDDDDHVMRIIDRIILPLGRRGGD
jgi:pilus assembly protein CpaF